VKKSGCFKVQLLQVYINISVKCIQTSSKQLVSFTTARDVSNSTCNQEESKATTYSIQNHLTYINLQC